MRKRSGSPREETDESRANEPARGESGPEAPKEIMEKASRLGIFGKPKRRSRKRNAEQDSAQGSLFDESLPPRAQGARQASSPGEAPSGSPSPANDTSASSPSGEAQTAGKKSRSKRRRERRKAAKVDESGRQQTSSPREAQAPTGPGETQQRKGPKPAAKVRAEGQGGNRPERSRPQASNNRNQQRPRPEGRPEGRQKSQRGKSQGGKPGRRTETYRESRYGAGGGRGRPEGLPPLSPEDLAAVAQSGYDGDTIPRFVSNERGRPRGGSAAPAPTSVRRLETLSPSSECVAALEALEQVLDEVVPLQPKHRAELRGDIRRLWEELTSDRESRSSEYLGTPPALSAYLRYFLPWNIFRLTSILANADFCLPDNAVVVDIGSGPLTVPIALWISRPELREVPLTIYCMDRVERVMESGLAILQTLCMRVSGRLPPWRIELRKDSFGAQLPERAHLLTAANVFNEFFWKDKRSLGERAIDTARSLLSYTKENGSLFVMEPGDPRSGAFIAALRAALIAEGAAPLGPCPHALACPMPGIFRHLLPPEETRTVRGDPNIAPSRFVLPTVVMPKKRDKYPWCHFGVDALKAPAWLEALSEEAGLPKERAVLSYLWAARGALARTPMGMPQEPKSSDRERRTRAVRGILVRVVSDPFSLPDGSSGQYACSSIGYSLIRRQRGEESFASGDLLEVVTGSTQRTDDKSGAVVLTT